MTTTEPGPATESSPTAATSAPPTPSPGPGPLRKTTAPRWWRRPAVRAAVLVALVLGLVVGLTLLATDESSGEDLDPRSAAPTGTLALAELLRDRGVAVDRGPGAGPGATLVVPFAGRLDPAELERLLDASAGANRVLLLSAADVPGTGITEGRLQGVSSRQPACSLPAATTAGSAEVGGRTYRGAGTSCYGGSLGTADRGGTPVVVLGSPTLLTNEALESDGNAALALGLFSGEGLPGQPSGSVVWYQPALDPAAEPPGLIDLLPDGVLWAVLQLFVAAVVVALWRGRRLGPVVEEPLPVVVPAAETVEGRARLYAAGRARSAAAEALRAGARARLGNAVDVGGEPEPTSLVTTVAARSGRQPGEIAELLYGSAERTGPFGAAGPDLAGAGGGAPVDDAALIRLADEIDRLEREVRGR